MPRQQLYFQAPYQVAVREAATPEPEPDQLLVRTMCSAISPGTEMLVYRGQMPDDMAVDATIEALAGEFRYPLTYGYAAVGRVTAVGAEVDGAWRERLVFAFNPHESAFLARPEQVTPLPAGMEAETAVFLPNMETAVSFLMDAQPMIGEQTAVFGQGVVGLLTTALLAETPLRRLVTLDRHPLRRQWSLELGADASLDPAEDAAAIVAQLCGEAPASPYAGADLTFELSGNPAALDQAIAVTGYNGRILVGSWYGQKRADLDLGGRFHRNHMRLISSQVSRIAPRWSGRWTKERRLQIAWQALARRRPHQLITHRFPITEAAAAYELIDRHPESAIQVMFTYE
jgi:2-desacetyl-2-hydroxyethyl bacteriochlorophyllide A dehydrogenase